MPRGFPSDHPAAAFLRYKQFLAGCERPAEFAISPGFYRTLVAAFRTLAPLIAFLNEPLVAGLQSGMLGRAWTDARAASGRGPARARGLGAGLRGAGAPGRRERPGRVPGVVHVPRRRPVLPAHARCHRLRGPRAPCGPRGAARAHARVAPAGGPARRGAVPGRPPPSRGTSPTAGRSSASAPAATPSSPTPARSSRCNARPVGRDFDVAPGPATCSTSTRTPSAAPDHLMVYRRPVALRAGPRATGSSITRARSTAGPARCGRPGSPTSRGTPRARWRPLPHNPAFVGVFRLDWL